MMRRILSVAVAGALVLAAVVMSGCLPIDLDTADGKVLIPRKEGFFVLDTKTGGVTRVYKPEDQAVFGRFLPDGKRIVVVTQKEGAGMGGAAQKVEVVTLADGTAKEIFNGSNTTYVTVSRDGTWAGVTRLSDAQVDLGGGEKDNLPELTLVNLGSGESKSMKELGGLAAIHRWSGDSKSVLVFQIKKKIKETSQYEGVISLVDVASGKATELASAIGGNGVFFDLASDGKTALFTARAAGAVGAKLAAEGDSEKLYELDVAKKTVRELKSDVLYAVYSPKATRVLIVGKDGNNTVAWVGDRGVKTTTELSRDLVAEIGAGMGPNTKAYANWADEDHVVYLAQHEVYGVAGKNLELVVIGADGKGRKSLQTAVDTAAEKGK